MEIFGSYDNDIKAYNNAPKEDKNIIVKQIMNNINKNLFIEKGWTDSLYISDLLDIKHFHLLETIRNKFIDNIIFENFPIDINNNIILSTYKTKQNKDVTMYKISQFGFIMLSMFIGNYDLILYKEGVIRIFNHYEKKLFTKFSNDNEINNTYDLKLTVEDEDISFTVIDDDVLTVSSLELAKIFEKEHYHILDCIRDILENCSTEFGESNCRFTIRKWSQEMPNGGIGEHDEPIYYVTQNMYSLIVATFRSDESGQIDYHKILLLNMFERLIMTLNNVDKGNIEGSKIDAKYLSEERSLFYKSFSKIRYNTDQINQQWNLFINSYDGLEKEVDYFYNFMMNKKGTVTISDIFNHLLHLNEQYQNITVQRRFFDFLEFIDLITKEGSSRFRKLDKIPSYAVEELKLFKIVEHSSLKINYLHCSKEAVKLIFMLRKAFVKYSLLVDTSIHKESIVKIYHEFYNKYKIIQEVVDNNGNTTILKYQ